MSKDLMDEIMDFIDDLSDKRTVTYAEIIGALTTTRLYYEAKFASGMADNFAEDDEEECQCGCAETCVPKLQ